MNYSARASGIDCSVSLEREGLRIGGRFIDFADVKALTPLNHRVVVDLLDGEKTEISMLGFSYDGFWEELSRLFAERTLEALFVEGEPIMSVEGDYETALEKGRGRIDLYSDSVCILPPSCAAVRIPLCFTRQILADGYRIAFTTYGGDRYYVGRMGYDTKPFAERAQTASDRIKKERASILSGYKTTAPFSALGLFRTTTPAFYWQAAFGDGRCAVELFTDEDAATYLYRFDESNERFALTLEEALEAVGTHREIIYYSDEQLNEKPLYRMSAARCAAVRTLRAHSAGRLIHSKNHAEKLAEFLG